jgi:hypothetical protein
VCNQYTDPTCGGLPQDYCKYCINQNYAQGMKHGCAPSNKCSTGSFADCSNTYYTGTDGENHWCRWGTGFNTGCRPDNTRSNDDLESCDICTTPAPAPESAAASDCPSFKATKKLTSTEAEACNSISYFKEYSISDLNECNNSFFEFGGDGRGLTYPCFYIEQGDKSYTCQAYDSSGMGEVCTNVENTEEYCCRSKQVPATPAPAPASPLSPSPSNDKSKSKNASGECVVDDGLIGNGWLSFSNDGCKYKGETYLNYKNAPDGACDCPNWYNKKSTLVFVIICIIIFLICIGALIRHMSSSS